MSDDSDTQTLADVKSGVIGGTVVQMPYQQGYHRRLHPGRG